MQYYLFLTYCITYLVCVQHGAEKAYGLDHMK